MSHCPAFYLTQTPPHWTWKGFWQDKERRHSERPPAQKRRGLDQGCAVQRGGCVRMQVSPHWQRYRWRGKESLKRQHLGPPLRPRNKAENRKTAFDRFPGELKWNHPERTLVFPCKLYKCTGRQQKTASFVNLQNSQVPCAPICMNPGTELSTLEPHRGVCEEGDGVYDLCWQSCIIF